MPDPRLKGKIEALLEEKIPAIEVHLAEVSLKQDHVLERLEDVSRTLTTHVELQTKHELRIAAIEVRATLNEDKAKDVKTAKRAVTIAALSSVVAAVVGFLFKWLMEK